MEKELSEPARQIKKIFEDYYDPEKKEQRKILNNREKIKEEKEKDLGI